MGPHVVSSNLVVEPSGRNGTFVATVVQKEFARCPKDSHGLGGTPVMVNLRCQPAGLRVS